MNKMTLDAYTSSMNACRVNECVPYILNTRQYILITIFSKQAAEMSIIYVTRRTKWYDT